MDNEDSLENIINEYSGFRLRFLKYVHYYICFPIFKDDGCYESREELVERDEFSTEHIRRIFSGLKKMENRAGIRNRGSYRLTLQIHFVGNDYCAHRLHSQCRVHLLEPETLPRLVSVNSLYLLTEDSSQKLDYRILIDLALQVPNSKHLERHMDQEEWTPSSPYEPYTSNSYLHEYDGPRRDSRHNFGKALTLTSGVSPALQRVELDLICRSGMITAEEIDQ
jgi:hypothetical protein